MSTRLLFLVFLAASARFAFGQTQSSPNVTGLAALTANIESTVRGRTLAVMPFREYRNKESRRGTDLTEELHTRLSNLGTLHMAVRDSTLEQVFRELKLTSGGVIDPSTAGALGKLRGVDVLVTDYFRPERSPAIAYCNLVDVSTGIVVKGWIVEIPDGASTPWRLRFSGGYSFLALDPNLARGLTAHDNNHPQDFVRGCPSSC
jgi:TolB-like protein